MATDVIFQAGKITKLQRAEMLNQTPICLWFTGFSGSGKSTLAHRVETEFHALGRHVYVLDGDNVRHGLNSDLGFTDGDRVENIRRVTEVARLMVAAGLIVIVAFISPFRADRLMARNGFESGEFFEVFVDTPLAICEQRDVKGFYKKARNNEIQHFTGISSCYEPPEYPELRLTAGTTSIEECVKQILSLITA